MDERLEYLWIAMMIIGAIPLGVLAVVPIFILFTKKSSTYWAVAILSYILASALLASFNLLLFIAILGSLGLIKEKSVVLIMALMGLAILSTFIAGPAPIALVSLFIIGAALSLIQHPELVDYFYGRRPQKNTEDPYLRKLDTIEKNLKRLKHENRYR